MSPVGAVLRGQGLRVMEDAGASERLGFRSTPQAAAQTLEWTMIHPMIDSGNVSLRSLGSLPQITTGPRLET